MKKAPKKLELHRETLQALALEKVTGGTGKAETGCVGGCERAPFEF